MDRDYLYDIGFSDDFLGAGFLINYVEGGEIKNYVLLGV